MKNPSDLLPLKVSHLLSRLAISKPSQSSGLISKEMWMILCHGLPIFIGGSTIK